MSSNDDVLPDTLTLLETFPEEIWIVIVQQIIQSNDSQDSENLCNASQYFRRHLWPDRVLFLFPNVWQVIGVKHNLLYWSVRNGWVQFDNRVRDTYRLRSVCQAWKEAIDKYFQSEMFYWTPLTDFTFHQYDQWFVESVTTVLRTGTVRRFLEHFERTHSAAQLNPFIVRSVAFDFDFSHFRLRAIDYMRYFEMFFCLYGHHLWSICIYIKNWDLDPYQNYCKIREWLQMMPNLRYLKIYNSASSPQRLECVSDISALPLPKLEHLSHFSLNGLPRIIVGQLVETYDHVVALEMFASENSILDEPPGMPFPHLVELDICVYSESQVRSLESIKVQWKLKRLGVYFDGFYDWQNIFNLFANNWGDSLKRLVVTLPKTEEREEIDKISKESISYRLDLPVLEELHVEIENMSSMDFLVPLKDSLVTLDVRLRYMTNSRRARRYAARLQREQVIEFLGHTGNLYESNIWRHLPNLKSVHIEERVVSKNPKYQYDHKAHNYKRNKKC